MKADYAWYERSPSGNGVSELADIESEDMQRGFLSRLVKPSPLFRLFEQLNPPPKHKKSVRPLTKAQIKSQISRQKAREKARRKKDASDVLTGRKIAITQKEYDDLTERDY